MARRLWPRALILAYHRVADPALDPYGQAVSPQRFAEQMAYLRHTYAVDALDSLLPRLGRRAYRDRTVVVTFDDGYADNLMVGYPIARRHEVPITLFATVQPILDGGRFWWDDLTLCLRAGHASRRVLPLEIAGRPFEIAAHTDRDALQGALHAALRGRPRGERERVMDVLRCWAAPKADSLDVGRPLTPSELREMSRLAGVTIGAHTMTHPVLRSLPPPEQAEELGASKAALERLLDLPVTVAAYPFGKPGDVGPATRGAARRAGYRAACTTIPGPIVPAADRYALPRLTVHDWTVEEFARRLRALLGEGPA